MAFERWSKKQEEVKTFLKFLQGLQNKLKQVNKFSQANLVKSNETMEQKFNVAKVRRHFLPGEKILILLSIALLPFQAKFVNSYEVKQR